MSYAKPHGQALSVTTFSRNGRRRKRGEGNHSEWGDLSESPNLEPPPFLSLSVAVGRARIEGYKPIIIITFSSWLWEDGERERGRKAVFVSGIAQPPDQIMEHLNGICWTISNGPNIRSGALFLSFLLSERTLPPPNIITILCCIIKGDCKIFGVIDGMAASALAPARLHSPEF